VNARVERVPTVHLLLEAESLAFAATSTRMGGVSEGSLGTLNLGFRAADAPDRVRENRRRFAAALGVDSADFVCARQVHGKGVAVASREARGRGALGPDAAFADCDALVTGESGVPLLILSADCPVVVVADRRRPALGAAHAGWRGLLGGVLENTVDFLVRLFGSNPADLAASVSPCIGACCFEVGDDVVAAGRRAVGEGLDAHLSPGRGERPHLDLPGVARAILVRMGLDPAAIRSSPDCTRCHADTLYSYRGSGGQCGLLGTAAALRGE
jgi:YfiH family protein